MEDALRYEPPTFEFLLLRRRQVLIAVGDISWARRFPAAVSVLSWWRLVVHMNSVVHMYRNRNWDMVMVMCDL
jgi:hypothetical protein